MKVGNPHRPVTSAWLTKESHRLDAPPFLSGAVEARVLLDKLTVPKQPLRDVTAGHSGGIYNGPQFKRNYVTSPEHGVPFLTGSSILLADTSRLPMISRKDAVSKKLAYLRVEEGMTLISCSGSIGKMAYARSELAGVWASQDVMKVVPNPEVIPPGYLYAYLSSRFGKTLVTSGTYGAIIQHIEPEHIADLQVPRFGTEFEERVHRLVGEASSLLTQFSKAINAATTEALSANGLEHFSSSEWHATGRDLGFTTGFGVRSMRALNYNPRYVAIVRQLTSRPHVSLGMATVQGTLKSGPRFKRIDADPQHSYMLIGQRDVFAVEPEGRWIAKNATSDDVLVPAGSTVMAAQGTLGEDEVYCRPVFVWSTGAEYAYSQHFLRIIPDPEKILPGYLFAFMRSEYGFRMFRSISTGTKLQGNHPELLSEIPVPLPSHEAQQAIHSQVVDAHVKRWRAVELEQQARQLVEQAIEKNFVPSGL
ncbi:methylation-associated defense system restriction endonuclease subunit S MAD5 [Deinococcus enclensis]|uniref:Type I restriction enzyme S subunit n=1 Tax=Deinococcus enclensis TaxID=1049582 RepID=A0ABT9MG32_9DEIO|nr:hypothetical protein [Deinococcus enclensis]MDP9765556.1 type I restriction enzyme S subunit [Deinococcus enclensis]